MTTTSTADATVENTDRRVWPALLTMFLGSFTLVTAEFLPPAYSPRWQPI